MIRVSNSRGLSAVFMATLVLAHTNTLADEDAPAAKSNMEALGDERYRIGEIIVDKAAREFSVPGKVLHLDQPLEYLAVSKGGHKSYESLLELSTSAQDFNLACILIGLDDKESVKPRYQFDDREVDGQAVAIMLTWRKEGKTVRVSAANAMTAGKNAFDDDSWVYIGSSTSEDGKQFMADLTGTLISFVHDPYSVIDHKSGAGIGAYGLLTGNEARLPAKGSSITLVVSLIQD